MTMRFILALIFVVNCVSAYDGNAMLTSIMVKASSRGLAIVVETDEPAVESYQSVLEGKNTVLRIFLKDVVYGLDEFIFSDFPESCPVKEIYAQEETGGSLVIKAIFRKQFYTKTKAKRVGNRNLFLVSSDPFYPYTWKTSGGKVADNEAHVSPQPGRTSGKPAVLSSIRLLKRGDVEQLVITADNPVRIKIQRKDGIIIAVFENVINGLSGNSYSLPSSTLFKRVTVKESVRGSNRIGIVVENTSPSQHSSFVEIKSKQCVVYAVPQTSSGTRGLALWTHDGGINTSYDFTMASTMKSIPAVPKKAETAKPDVVKHLVVIRDNVNFRMEPKAESSENIILSLRIGTEGVAIKKQGKWMYMRLNDSNTEGWIYGTLVVEKLRITQEQRNAILQAQVKVPTIPVPQSDDDSSTPKAIEKVTAEKTVEEVSANIDKAVQANQESAKRITRYRQYGRDPFLPLNQADFLQSELLKVESCVLVGILYDRTDQIALLEDGSKGGAAFSLRKRDAISNGRVLKIRENEVVFLLNEAGFSRKFVLKLNPKKE